MSNLTVNTINSRTTGDTTIMEWNNSFVDYRIPYDRANYDTVRLYGWFDVPSGTGTNGLYFQPTTGSNLDGRLLSFMNGNGSTQTWVDPDGAQANADQMYWNAVSNDVVRWQIDLTLMNTFNNVWSSTIATRAFSLTSSYGKGFRFLQAQSWDNAGGNNLNGWRIYSSLGATNNQGALRLTYSKLNII